MCSFISFLLQFFDKSLPGFLLAIIDIFQLYFSVNSLKTVYNTASNLKMIGEKYAWFAMTKVDTSAQQTIFVFIKDPNSLCNYII